jgi:hypothetical protein
MTGTSIETTLELWASSLRDVKARMRPLFTQDRVGASAGLFLDGLLGDERRKTGWMRAEAAGDPGPWRQQAILGRGRWDADALRDIERNYVVEHLADEPAVLVLVETRFLKQGKASCGVSRQYTGSAGKITNCQIGVFAAYVSRHGHAFIDRALYLPKNWTDDLARHAAHRRQRIGVDRNPVRQRLAPGRLGVNEAGGAPHGDEDLRRPHLSGRPLDHLHGATSKVDEQLLARRVHLTQRRLQVANLLPIQVTERGITKPVQRRSAVFFPQQCQRHVRPPPLAMNGRPVRNRALIRRHVRRRWKQHRFKLNIVEPTGQRPAETGPRCPLQIFMHRALAQPQAMTNRALRQPAAKPQSQNLAYLPHRQSLARHLDPLVLGKGSRCRRLKTVSRHGSLPPSSA